MKLYLKILLPLFIFTLVYSFLVMFFGPRGFFAHKQLRQQREALVQHVRLLSDIGEDLSIRIANLSSDPQTISAYAHELGYVKENERLIKLMNFSGAVEYTENAGTPYLVQEPHYLPDAVCKTIAISISIIVLMCEVVVGKKYAY